MEESRFCTNCGKKISNDVRFCSNCGKEVLSPTNQDIKSNNTVNLEKDIQNNNTINVETVNENKQSYNNSSYNNSNQNYAKIDLDFNNKDVVNFIQKNADYYIPKFQQMKMKNSSVSWNWASFLAGACWFLYRKMYAIGFGIIAANCILTFLVPVIAPITTIGIPIACGLFGNNLYMKHVENKLQEVSNMDENMKQSVIISQGGVNIVIPIIVIVLVIITSIILVSLGLLAIGLAGAAYY